MRRALPFAVSSSLVLLCATASADADRGARLVTHAGTAACTLGGALELAVTRRLGATPFDERAPNTVTVTVEEEPTALSATVVWEGADGTTGRRVLQAPSCDALVERVAVTISVLLESARETERPPAPRSNAPDAELASLPEAPKLAEAPPPPKPSSAGHLRAVVGLGMAIGASPAPAPSAEVGVAIGRGLFSLGLGGRADLPTSLVRDDGKGVRASVVAFELAPCVGAFGERSSQRSQLDLCAVAFAGAIFGEGIGVNQPDRATSFFAAAGPRAKFELPVAGRLGVYAFGDLLVPITRMTMRVENDPVWTASVVQMRVGLGLATSIL